MTTPQDRKKLIEYMLCEVEADMEDKGRSNDFINSIREQFDERGTLSDKQLEAVRRFYERI